MHSPSDVIAKSELSDTAKAAVATTLPEVRTFEDLQGYAPYNVYYWQTLTHKHGSTHASIIRAMARRGLSFMTDDEEDELLDFCGKLLSHMHDTLSGALQLVRIVEARLRTLKASGIDLKNQVSFDDRSEADCLILLVDGKERYRWTVSVSIVET
jgi:hypothetical protein